MTNDKTKILIPFKSIPEMYEKEKSGKKPNTVRVLAVTDQRYEYIFAATHIRIINTETKESFEREITDVTCYDGRYIISWKHPLPIIASGYLSVR